MKLVAPLLSSSPLISIWFACRGSGGSSSVELTAAQRVSIRQLPYTNSNVSLYFTCDECNEVMAGSCNTEKHGDPPSPELQQYLWEFTNEHLGGVRAVLDMLDLVGG